MRFSGRSVGHGFAHIAKCVVQLVGERVDDWRLLFAGNDDAGAAIFLKIAGHCGNPSGLGIAQRFYSWLRLGVDLMCQFARNILHLAGVHRQAMIGHGAGDGGGAFHGVEAVHFFHAGAQAAAISELARVAEPLRMSQEEVRVERENHPCFLEMVMRFHNFTEGHLRTVPGIVTQDGLILMPFGRRKFLQHSLDLCGKGGGSDCFRQNPHAGSVFRLLLFQRGIDGGQEGAPGTDVTGIQHGLGTVGIIEVKNRRLIKNTGCAEAGGVVGITFDFGGMTFVTFDEQAGGKSIVLHGGGKVEWLAQNKLFRLPDVGDNILNGLTGAGGQAGQRQRCPH